MDEIATLRLRLRRLTPADRPALLSMLGDYDVVKNLSKWPHPVDLKMVDSLIDNHLSDNPRGYAICYGDELAGMISKGPRIGYFSDRRFWGKGIMTEALAAVSRKALQTEEVLWSGAFEDNPASIRVLEKCGWHEVPGDMEFSVARNSDIQERGFVKSRRYDWLEPIKTDRLVLRPLGLGDLDAVWEIVSDAEIVRMLLSWPKIPDKDYTIGRLKNGLARLGLVSAIVLGGYTVGMIGCCAGSIWYALSREVWGRGIGTEALRAKIRVAFDHPSVTQLSAGTWHDNPVSMHMLEKVGFEQTGRSELFCAGRNEIVEGPDYTLTRQRWLEFA